MIGVEQAVSELLSDDLAFISSFYELADKRQQTVPFVPKPMQRKAVENLTLRDVWVKPGQTGMTSIATALMLKRTSTTPNTTTVFMAYNEKLPGRLLRRTRSFYNSSSMPERLRLRVDHDSTSELRFPTINSVIYILTAGAAVAGRGEPIHNLLISEAAFYEEGALERVVLPSIERVPESGLVIMESTPNGEDPIFYEEIQKALKGESVFHLQVFYWWEEPDNQLTSGSPLLWELPELRGRLTLTDEEALLSDLHGWTEDQVRWRRYKIRSLGPLFWQEHLESLNTCFLIVGLPFYDPRLTLELSKQCYQAPHSFGQTQVWYEPEEGGQYVMGIDPGQGRVTQSACTIFRYDTEPLQHCATLATMDEPSAFAVKCSELGRHYNTALAVPEANSQGIAFLDSFRNYPRIYLRRRINQGTVTMEKGWLTSGSTKPYMMAELGRRLPQLETHDEELIRQIRSMRDDGKGRGVTTVMDDIHDSACLAFVGLVGVDPHTKRGYVGRSGWNW